MKKLIDENKEQENYIILNAKAKIFSKNGENFLLDKQAASEYYYSHVKPRTKKFLDYPEKLKFLIDNDYYDKAIIEKYKIDEVHQLHNYALSFQFRFSSFMGILKFYNSYALKSFCGNYYLENYEDRVLMNALFFGNGSFLIAKSYIKEILEKRFQPATPTFLNAGKSKRGEYISCYLLRVEDNLESIARGISTSLQLSKRGGGVSLCLTNLRERGAPIKKNKNQATGVIPVMKILEDSFSYANQLGQRQGAGAVYLHAHHPDILEFLDTKKENADEKIRIKSLSLGVIVPDITFKLAKNNEQMALFSPYDVYKVYQKPLSDIAVSEKYEEMLANPAISKKFISARKFFQHVAELHFESGYPYLLFDDTVNRDNAFQNRIVMSNLCSEIVQPSTASEFASNLNFTKIGNDICCNLGSLNIDAMMKKNHDFANSVFLAVAALDHVSRHSNLDSAPSIEKGNQENHAIGLGVMNLHGFLATHQIYYNSPEALDFTSVFFYVLAYNAFKASNQLAQNFGKFKDFANSKFADGSWFNKYTTCTEKFWHPKTAKIKTLFAKYQIKIPTRDDWQNLVIKIKQTGLANSHLMAVAPTGSISYLTGCTPSLQPIVSPIEVRKEGKLGRIYVPAYNISFDNLAFYQDGAYELGPNPIIDIVSEAQKHVDQAISLTLFMNDKITTRDLNKAYIRAFSKKCKSIYYVRIRQEILQDSEKYDECEACVI